MLLHGAFTDASEFGSTIPALAQRFRLFTPERRGHGHTPDVPGPISYDLMAATEPTLDESDLARVAARTLVMAGDDDMISAEHTLRLYRGIPDSELAVVPGTSHALIIEKPDLCNRIILDFLTKDPVPTFMPMRRA